MMGNFSFSSLIEGNKESLPEKVANHILKKVFVGELKQGDRLIETDIAKELNVSNIPVRESFYILQNTGVIERLPRKGVRVKAITEKEFQDYTNALVDILNIAIDSSKKKWNEEKHNNLKRLLNEAHVKLLEKNILQYIIHLHRLCGYIFEVADNQAFIKFYSDITFITNAYSQMMWGNVEKTMERYAYAEAMVHALIQEDYEQAKESMEILTRESLSL